jgi:hypothetical protein
VNTLKVTKIKPLKIGEERYKYRKGRSQHESYSGFSLEHINCAK